MHIFQRQQHYLSFICQKAYKLIISKLILQQLVMNKEDDCLKIQFSDNSIFSKSVDISRRGSHRQNSYELEDQMKQLKQKAHKSFLQVIQMENLHQEQIELLRQQYEQKQKSAAIKQQQLQQQINRLQNQLKLANRHNLQLSFSLQSIEGIGAKDSNQTSRFEQSSILQMKQLLSARETPMQDKIKVLKQQISKQLQLPQFREQSQYQKKVTHTLEKLFNFMKQMNEQNIQLQYKYDDLDKTFNSLEAQFKTLKMQYQSAQKQNKFLSDHLKRVISDKTNFQKKLTDLQKTKRNLEDNLKIMKKNVTQVTGVQPIIAPLRDKDLTCINIDNNSQSSTSNIFTLQDLNTSKDSQISSKTQTSKFSKPYLKDTLQNNAIQNQNSLIKMFKKRKEPQSKNQSINHV